MKIHSAEFELSCVKPEQYPRERLLEVAFVGRSNVGKSSTINSLLNRKKLSKVSVTPGKTQTLNFFRIKTADKIIPDMFFVDLPGYGYAKVSKSVRQQWGPMIERYLSEREQLFAVVQLVDSRGVEAHDVTTYEWLCHIGHPPIVVTTKVDKLNRSQRNPCLTKLCQSLQLPNPDDVILYSAKTNEGRLELWKAIRERRETAE
ncbi:ribosome biogenesis GTP-binding protein YihA/YsxC [Candidatus Nitronereus thalassa]|uniref:Probable GTP-binding protein EngB n=1 Tax=Candidatus Nitronereus thalassa TaxID=3020898 RepID=A0ABU3K9N8_9BACT|nr:ribosome biogenesis GTP-binding protein YihA/YsxC [Candidatus Nitronereus thalassa]MDT7043087.1 ribosome biogenesis GTP-binding protein YihA/YsxC [Candidatus Nitronereus thalassa]